MKFVLYISFLLLSAVAVGQNWRDTLADARSAYDKKEYGRALDKYRSAQKLAPESVDLSQEMGQAAYKDLQYSEAEKIFRQQAHSVKNLSQKEKAYHNLGNSLMQQKKYEEAIEAYRDALRLNPSNEKTRHNLSEAMRKRKEEQEKKNKEDKKQDTQNQNQKDQQNQQNQQSQQQQGNNQSQSKSDSKPSAGENQTNDGKSKLQDKEVEKKLNELMKQESETKRRMGGTMSRSGSKTGKDW